MACVHPVDVVIVDYFMPEMDGQEFSLEMRQLRPQAPIIMLSAAADVPMEALKLVDAFIPKADLADALL
ncbi:MAG: response regulator transcription factor, partial [Terriglobales bacterium]